MLISSDFIFIHIPKTGGTFVNETLLEYYKPKRFFRPSMFLKKHKILPYCIRYSSKVEYPNLSGYTRGIHCGLRHIKQSNKPKFHIKRPPEDFYKSLFYYKHYVKYPHFSEAVLAKEFDDFPNLKPHETFKYYKMLAEKITGIENLKFGYLTFEIIEELSPTEEIRNQLVELLQHDKVDGAVQLLRSSLSNMHILEMKNLNAELYQFLKQNTKLKNIESLLEAKKVNVSKKDKSVQNTFSTDEIKKYDAFAYQYWDYQ